MTAFVGLIVKPAPAAATDAGALQEWSIQQDTHVDASIKVTWGGTSPVWGSWPRPLTF